MVMGSIYPEYIRSDESLTTGSRRVWNVMYNRSDVERSWIGNWGMDEVITSWNVSDMSEQENIVDILDDIENDVLVTEKESNDEFVRNLDSDNKQKLGPFYAYRRQSEISTKSAIQDLAENFKASVDEIKIALEMAAALHFERLYRKSA